MNGRFSIGTLCLLVAVPLSGCGADSSNRNLSYGDSAEAAYQEAYEDFEDGDCLDAEPAFRKVRREYPYSRYAALSELRIADCLLQQDKAPEAIAAYRRFVRNRPSHAEVPYARFKIASAYFEQIPDEWLLSPPAYERDQGPTREALRQLRRFILDFPEDERVEQANEMVRQALELLARHELYVADFYLGRGHPQAAVMRLETLVNSYEGSGIEAEAMLLLGRVHLNMEDEEKARETFEELIDRYPDSGHAEQARAFLREL
jgi:outer membrane protein assembly factor BamD